RSCAECTRCGAPGAAAWARHGRSSDDDPPSSGSRSGVGYSDRFRGRRGRSMSRINRSGVLAGKVAVVTGASRGIGEAIALRYAMEGARVVVSARTVEESEHFLPGTIKATAERIRAAGGEALAVKADLSREDERRGLIDQAREAFGPVDILVNNAAVTYFIPV